MKEGDEMKKYKVVPAQEGSFLIYYKGESAVSIGQPIIAWLFNTPWYEDNFGSTKYNSGFRHDVFPMTPRGIANVGEYDGTVVAGIVTLNDGRTYSSLSLAQQKLFPEIKE